MIRPKFSVRLHDEPLPTPGERAIVPRDDLGRELDVAAMAWGPVVASAVEQLFNVTGIRDPRPTESIVSNATLERGRGYLLLVLHHPDYAVAGPPAELEQHEEPPPGVIAMEPHREVPGTLWCSYPGRCMACGYEAMYVSPMPAWAASPPPADCQRCHAFASILQLAEMPAEFNGPEAKAWDLGATWSKLRLVTPGEGEGDE